MRLATGTRQASPGRPSGLAVVVVVGLGVEITEQLVQADGLVVVRLGSLRRRSSLAAGWVSEWICLSRRMLTCPQGSLRWGSSVVAVRMPSSNERV
jgi:hypothetical protein